MKDNHQIMKELYKNEDCKKLICCMKEECVKTVGEMLIARENAILLEEEIKGIEFLQASFKFLDEMDKDLRNE